MDTRIYVAQILGIAPGEIRDIQTVSGGDISTALKVTTLSDCVFVKINSPAFVAAFAAEADGLRAIAETGVIRVPTVIGCAHDTQRSWLVLEWLDLVTGDAGSAESLGRSLAALHLVRAPQHGWHADNFIGASPQSNDRSSDWTQFYAQQRLATQAALLGKTASTQTLLPKLKRVIAKMPALLAGHEPAASLLHGDLWGGNWASLRDATPVVYDPAAYYGDRETDIAMTQLFGGFPQAFYDAYNEVLPLGAGYERRRELYQLYHVLNHALLFGAAYEQQADRILSRLAGR